MLGDPAFEPWDIPVVVDPDMPPGVIELRSGEDRTRVKIRDGWMYGEYPDRPSISDEEALRMAGRQLRERAAADPLFAEDIKSIAESAPFMIQLGDETARIGCERCGTTVYNPLERRGLDGHWVRAIWETDAGRKHTLRRCDWQREHAASR